MSTEQTPPLRPETPQQHARRIQLKRDLELILRHHKVPRKKIAGIASHYFRRGRLKGEL